MGSRMYVSRGVWLEGLGYMCFLFVHCIVLVFDVLVLAEVILVLLVDFKRVVAVGDLLEVHGVMLLMLMLLAVLLRRLMSLLLLGFETSVIAAALLEVLPFLQSLVVSVTFLSVLNNRI